MDSLPKDVQEGLQAAHMKAARKKAHMRVAVGDETFPVLEFREGGFALDMEDAPKLRGLVDLYAGENHMYQCLIVASSEEAGEVVYDFKRSTRATDVPPADFAVEPGRPVGLIARD